jgi:hypothetical protein
MATKKVKLYSVQKPDGSLIQGAFENPSDAVEALIDGVGKKDDEVRGALSAGDSFTLESDKKILKKFGYKIVRVTVVPA